MRLPKVWLVWVLLAAFVAIFALMEFAGGSTSIRVLIQFGADYRDLVLAGQWWRLISSGLLHIGPFHLLMNGWALIVLGKALEEHHGPRPLWALFVLSVFGGGVTSDLLGTQVAAGASGGLFGMMGAYVVHYLRHRRAMSPQQRSAMERWLGSMVVGNVMLALSVPNIGHAAHFGGLITGMLCSLGLRPSRDEGRFQKIATWLVTVVSMVALLLAAWNAGEAKTGLWQTVASREWKDSQGRWSMAVPAVMHEEPDPHYQAVVGPGAVIAVQVVDDAGDDWREIERAALTKIDFSSARDEGAWVVAHARVRNEEHERWHGRFGAIIVRIDFATAPADFASFAPVIEKAIATFKSPP